MEKGTGRIGKNRDWGTLNTTGDRTGEKTGIGGIRISFVKRLGMEKEWELGKCERESCAQGTLRKDSILVGFLHAAFFTVWLWRYDRPAPEKNSRSTAPAPQQRLGNPSEVCILIIVVVVVVALFLLLLLLVVLIIRLTNDLRNARSLPGALLAHNSARSTTVLISTFPAGQIRALFLIVVLVDRSVRVRRRPACVGRGARPKGPRG